MSKVFLLPCLSSHVLLPWITSTFPSPSSFLFSTEGSSNFGSICWNVYIDNPAIRAWWSSPFENCSLIWCEKGTGKTLTDWIIYFNGFIKWLKRVKLKEKIKKLKFLPYRTSYKLNYLFAVLNLSLNLCLNIHHN